MSNLKDRVKELRLNEKKKKEFDPEDDSYNRDDDDDDNTNSEDEDLSAGREHYETVGTSKLRQPERVALDQKKYGGKAVSAKAALNGGFDEDRDPFAPADEDEDEDPFAAKRLASSEDEGDAESGLVESDQEVDEDDEIDSDEAFEEGDEDAFRGKGFVFRGSGKGASLVADAKSKTKSKSRDVEQDNEDDEDDEDEEGEEGSDASVVSEQDESDDMDDQSDVDMDDLGDDDEEEDDNDDDSDEDELSARPNLKSLKRYSNSDRDALRSLMSSDSAAIATSLSQAAAADAKKGAAVKQQYQTFDRLLDARIKLQKGVMAANDLTGDNDNKVAVSDVEAQNAIRKAEEAALKLFSTINSLRHTILDSTTGTAGSKKRKRISPATSDTTTQDLWSQIQILESNSVPHRRTILDKWSNKTRSNNPTTSTPSSASKSITTKLNGSFPQQQQQRESNLSTILEAYLHSESTRLISTSTTTSTTTTTTPDQPTQSNNPITYTDTTFYQSLLRDLITSRSQSQSQSSSISTTTNPIFSSGTTTKLHPSGSRTKKIDTKASKGRKVRYTVHEKLENFMAARGSLSTLGGGGGGGSEESGNGHWTEGATKEFFGSLLGNRGVLDENGVGTNNAGGYEHGYEDGNDGDEDESAGVLRLFRSAPATTNTTSAAVV